MLRRGLRLLLLALLIMAMFLAVLSTLWVACLAALVAIIIAIRLTRPAKWLYQASWPEWSSPDDLVIISGHDTDSDDDDGLFDRFLRGEVDMNGKPVITDY